MKKIILLLAMTFIGGSVFGQGIKIGVNAGIPIGDISDASNFQLGADLAYLYPLSELFSVCALAGY